jgi:hypothetical protein
MVLIQALNVMLIRSFLSVWLIELISYTHAAMRQPQRDDLERMPATRVRASPRPSQAVQGPVWSMMQRDFVRFNDLDALLTMAREAKDWISAHALKRLSHFKGKLRSSGRFLLHRTAPVVDQPLCASGTLSHYGLAAASGEGGRCTNKEATSRRARLRPIKAHHVHNKPASTMLTTTTEMLAMTQNINNVYNMNWAPQNFYQMLNLFHSG